MHNINLTVKIERAISELRRGGKVVISDNITGASILLISSEFIQSDAVESLTKLAQSRPNIILSANRCKAIGINSNKKPCSILINKNWSVTDIMSLCFPLNNHKMPTINGVITENNNGLISTCLLILRQARLLPAGLMTLISNISIEKIAEWSFKHNLIHVDMDDIIAYEKANANNLVMEVRANVPLAYTDNCEIIMFRPKDGGDEHFCLVFGKTREKSASFKEHLKNSVCRMSKV